MKLDEAYQIYYQQLSVNENRSLATLRSYESELTQYLAFLKNKDVADMREITHEILQEYVFTSMKTKKVRSVAHSLSVIRGFHAHIHQLYPEINDPSLKVRVHHPEKSLPKYFSESELEKLFDYFKDDDKGILAKAMFEMIYACGLRVSELCALTFNQLNVENRMLRVLGKGNKERLVPISSYSLTVLNEYLKIRPSRDKYHSPLIFINKKGKPVSRQSVWRMLHEALLASGANVSFSPHTLRHTFATDLLANGADLRSVQELLGHSSIATTQIYTHVQRKQLTSAYDRFFPTHHSEPEKTEKKGEEDDSK